ncbi:hypothetical protein A1OE_1517 [Candidatus Endolissoclinum faulkneri L2]|uniref:Uncharacterized protein n=1 Tax=Candidatus Endolissoclinum faulkneri L2 TaxID=1193729 RepID=K7ZDN4_9PROT|nr:hypothetical protein A1OE_1517 [Candidatus Endolissoclinum faulkneri L2]
MLYCVLQCTNILCYFNFVLGNRGFGKSLMLNLHNNIIFAHLLKRIN